MELGSEEEKRKAEESRRDNEKVFKNLMECLRSHLGEEIKEVRLSSRLTSSAACLVGEIHDPSPQMEEMMRRMGQALPKTKRILELNPAHSLLSKLQSIFEKDPSAPELKDYARLLHGQALLAEGSSLADPAGFSKLVADIMVRAIG